MISGSRVGRTKALEEGRLGFDEETLGERNGERETFPSQNAAFHQKSGSETNMEDQLTASTTATSSHARVAAFGLKREELAEGKKGGFPRDGGAWSERASV